MNPLIYGIDQFRPIGTGFGPNGSRGYSAMPSRGPGFGPPDYGARNTTNFSRPYGPPHPIERHSQQPARYRTGSRMRTVSRLLMGLR